MVGGKHWSGIVIIAGAVVAAACSPVPTANWGADGNTAVSASSPPLFYIGKLGQQAGACNTGTTAFDSASALAVGTQSTFEYWGLSGAHTTADVYGVDVNPYDWGFLRGEWATTCFLDAEDTYGDVSGLTIFADVESGFGGWATAGTTLENGATSWEWENVRVIQGFLDEISQSQQVSPGLYEGLDAYASFTPGFTWSSVGDSNAFPFVWWAAGLDNCDTNVSSAGSPAESSWVIGQFDNLINDSAAGTCTNGGNVVALWQYYGSSNSDEDITTQSLSDTHTTYVEEQAYYVPGLSNPPAPATVTGHFWFPKSVVTMSSPNPRTIRYLIGKG